MTLYVETSAVLAWLLEEPSGSAVEAVIREREAVVTSALTLVECDRTLLRFVAAGKASDSQSARLGRVLADATAAWSVQSIDALVVDRARQPFPDDRIRALDALHLAAALVVRSEIGDLDLLSLDGRVRSNAIALGFRVLPA
jgi:uncharacterized protein with PIN domain